MRIRWREWGVTAVAWIAVLGLAGMALAGAESGGGDDLAQPEPVVLAQEEDAPEVQGGDGEGHAVENHGRCVSSWAHRAKDDGLEGKAKGAFISSIAQDEAAVASKDEVGEACDFADELEAALAEQDAGQELSAEEGGETQSRGKSGDAPGKNRSGDGDEGSGDEDLPEEAEEEVEVPLETDV